MNSTEPIDVPPADSPNYRSWLPAPSALSGDLTIDPGHVIHARPKESERGGLSRLFSFAELLITSQIDWFGRDYSYYDRALMIDHAFVLTGEIDRSVVESALSNTAYEPADAYEGYDLYDRRDIRRTVAVGDDAIVFSNDENSEQNVRAVIDAGDGRIERYHETDEDFDRVVEAAGGRQFNWFTPTDTALIESISKAYDDDNVYQINHRLYSDATSFSEEELRREYESGGWEIDPRATEVHSDGRLATVIQQFDREKYLGASSEFNWPQVTWGVDHDEDSGQITLRHEAGDSIEAKLLTISHEHPGSDHLAHTQFDNKYEIVEPGDDLTIDLPTHADTEQIFVSYSPDGDSKTLLINHRIDR